MKMIRPLLQRFKKFMINWKMILSLLPRTQHNSRTSHSQRKFLRYLDGKNKCLRLMAPLLKVRMIGSVCFHFRNQGLFLPSTLKLQWMQKSSLTPSQNWKNLERTMQRRLPEQKSLKKWTKSYLIITLVKHLDYFKDLLGASLKCNRIKHLSWATTLL